jgi:pimeloyl-ACP methyl ester carboxylesterase
MSEALEAPTVREGRLTRPDGRTLAWVEAGVLDGRPILRLPGTPGSRMQVRPDLSPWLDRGLRMILTERPGFGASSHHPGRGFLDHADDLAAVLDTLGLDSVPIIGGSGAGAYLLAFAARHPERVRAVTVVVGAAPIEDEEAELMIGLNAAGYWLAKAGDRDGMTELLSPVRESMLADPLASFRGVMETAPPSDQEIMGDPAWQEYLRRGITEALRPGVEGWVNESMLMFGGWSDVDVTAVRASLTWWHGDHDRNAPLPAVRRLLREIPQARLIVWPEAGHLTAYIQEGAILDELLARV